MLQISISKRAAFIIAVALIMLVPAIALAGSVFNDVDDTSVHIKGITFMKDSGVSVGCDANNNYCPDDNVTRAQMGTFMYRLSGNDPATPPSVVAASALTADAATTAGDADTLDGLHSAEVPGRAGISFEIIEAPGVNFRGAPVTLASQLVVLPSAGWVKVTFDGNAIIDVGDRLVLAASDHEGWLPNSGNVGLEVINADVNQESFSHTRVYEVPEAGLYTYYAIGQNWVEQAGSGIASVYGTLTVEFYPKGLDLIIIPVPLGESEDG